VPSGTNGEPPRRGSRILIRFILAAFFIAPCFLPKMHRDWA
jgi:hypothetical protein